jgi:hypothetical protein
MRQSTLYRMARLILIAATVISCDLSTDPADETADTLYVKFSNEQASLFTISDIQLLDRGPVTAPTNAGTWGTNILPEGHMLAPGDSTYFTLSIPTGHANQYRLGVIDSAGSRSMLHLQPGYPDDAMLGTITHWGSDQRSVTVTVAKDSYSGLIVISGYSDYAGMQ